MRDVNVALIAISITPFETPPRLQRIFNRRAAIKLLTFIASCFPRKRLQSDVWQLALRHFVPKLFSVDYLNCVLLNCLAGIRVKERYIILVKNIDCND